MKRQAIYLDHNAATPLLPEAREAMLETLALTGNPSSVHAHGRALRGIVEASRDAVARLAGARRGEIVFTGSGTEAIAQALIGGARAFRPDALVVGAGEHMAVLRSAESTGLPVRDVGLTPEGLVDLDHLARRLSEADAAGETVLVALGWVNNETGVVQPMEAICAMVGPTRHLLFVDAVQALGKLPLAFSASAPDMMAVSGHKIGAPAGIGALLLKPHADDVRLVPGGGQEAGRRAGTEPVSAIAGFGAAAAAFSDRYRAAGVETLGEALEKGIEAIAQGAVVFGRDAPRIGNTLCFAVPGLSNSVALMGLDLMGISVSSGAACASGKVGASHVLAAMGIPPELGACALRVSLGWNSTRAEVDAFLDAFETVLARHRAGRAA